MYNLSFTNLHTSSTSYSDACQLTNNLCPGTTHYHTALWEQGLHHFHTTMLAHNLQQLHILHALQPLQEISARADMWLIAVLSIVMQSHSVLFLPLALTQGIFTSSQDVKKTLISSLTCINHVPLQVRRLTDSSSSSAVHNHLTSLRDVYAFIASKHLRP